MKRKIGIALLLLLGLTLAWQVLRLYVPQQERALRGEIRQAAETYFPEAASESRRRFGLQRLGKAQPGRQEVLLVHGLDDPGKVWMNLAPALVDAGYGVIVFTYPNDQPIAQSAAFMKEQMQTLAGLGRVQIVAHSMGGLVVRELLTAPQLACRPPACHMPSVQRLIMVGTPNHGSDLARVRGLAEVREQFTRLMNGEAGWLDWLFDGAGEAGLDLMPGSPFLQRLNARPNPPRTQLLTIAGIIGKPQLAALQKLSAEQFGQPLPSLDDAAATWGDGLVSVASARLDGVPLIEVSGTHLSMIRNVSRDSQRVPPAVPVILRLLARSPQAASPNR
jgi:pimeloyl-ACP methyl ester carboxylesterase